MVFFPFAGPSWINAASAILPSGTASRAWIARNARSTGVQLRSMATGLSATWNLRIGYRAFHDAIDVIPIELAIASCT